MQRLNIPTLFHMAYLKPALMGLVLLGASALLSACMGVPDKVSVVKSVDANQYLGTWYEIARLDHSFERDLEQVTANYSKNTDGSIKVINKGYNAKDKEWSEAVGKAYFIDPPNADGTFTGKLKVSFFGPFYGAYNIMELDKPYYNYVMVCGPDKEYFWILSRTPQLTYPIKQELISKAKSLGFATDKLIYVNQVPDTRNFKAGPHVE
jgi:apolipoprotein D and lipocalin family protein